MVGVRVGSGVVRRSGADVGAEGATDEWEEEEEEEASGCAWSEVSVINGKLYVQILFLKQNGTW